MILIMENEMVLNLNLTVEEQCRYFKISTYVSSERVYNL